MQAHNHISQSFYYYQYTTTKYTFDNTCSLAFYSIHIHFTCSSSGVKYHYNINLSIYMLIGTVFVVFFLPKKRIKIGVCMYVYGLKMISQIFKSISNWITFLDSADLDRYLNYTHVWKYIWVLLKFSNARLTTINFHHRKFSLSYRIYHQD